MPNSANADRLCRCRFLHIGNLDHPASAGIEAEVLHMALLHGSNKGRAFPFPEQIQAATFIMRTEFGCPASSIRFRIATLTAASAC